MTPAQTFAAIDNQPDGPVKKFQFIKTFGALLPPAAKTWSCAQIRAALRQKL